MSHGSRLRIECLILGYLSLGVTVVDTVVHVLTAAIVSHGFMCDVDKASLSMVDWPWLEPLLLVLNMGSRGIYFYAFPTTLPANKHEYMPISEYPRCYPGHFHVNLIDILTFLNNMIWLNFVKAYIRALHKKDPKPIKIFFDVSIVKLILQIMYWAYNLRVSVLYDGLGPIIKNTVPVEIFWITFSLGDIGMATGILLIVMSYINVLQMEISGGNTDWPGSWRSFVMGASACLFTKDKIEPADHVTVV